MKKLLTPILVLTLIVGFSALALGVHDSDSQTLTVNVSTKYSITAPTSDPSPTVGPKTSSSAVSLGTLTYKTNDTGGLKIVAEKGADTNWLDGLEVTFPAPTPSGDGDLSFSGSGATIGGTASDSAMILSGSGSAGTETCSLSSVTFSKVKWTEPGTSGASNNVKIIYKFLAN